MEKKKKEIIVNANVTIGIFGNMANCDGVIEKIIEPPTGGVFVKYIGCSYLFKGKVEQKVIDILGFPKRLFVNLLRLVSSRPGKILFVLLLFLPKCVRRRLFIAVAGWYLRTVYLPGLTKHLFLGDFKYCVSVRELYRVITLFIAKIKNQRLQSIAFKLRNIGCMILEKDAAYRFELQDILPEINIEALRKAPLKEIKRVFNILIQREPQEGMKEKWVEARKVLLLPFLRFSGVAREWLVEFLSELDFEKIKLDEADWYFCLRRTTYNFRGVPIEKRLRDLVRIDRERKHHIPSVEILSQLH